MQPSKIKYIKGKYNEMPYRGDPNKLQCKYHQLIFKAPRRSDEMPTAAADGIDPKLVRANALGLADKPQRGIKPVATTASGIVTNGASSSTSSSI